MAERIGFIGLGIMGQGMTRNLLKAGFDLTVWNRTRSKVDALVKDGAKAAETPSALASQCDIIFVCVSDTPDVKEVLFGENGVAQGARSGSLVVDHSTISPLETKEFATQLAQQGVEMLDAPISGGSEGAVKGTLSIMVGGKDEQFQRAKPYFEAMGKTITLVGENGDGQMVKLVNQILVVGGMLSISEALLFAEAGGLNLEKTLEAVSGGAAGSWALSNRGPQIVKRDFRPGFMIDLQEKDLRLVLDAADALSVPVMACSTAHHLYRTLQKRGLGEEGNHGLIKALEYLSDMTVGSEKDGN